MAQLVARLVRNEKVGGSNPPSSTTGRHPIRMSVFCMPGRCCGGALRRWCSGRCVCFVGPGCSVCPWAAARPRDRHTRACGSEWSISRPALALPPPTGTAAGPRHRPRAPQPDPAADHGHRSLVPPLARLGGLTSFGAAPRSPPVPSEPSGAFHTSGAWLLMCGLARRLEARPGPATAAGPRHRPRAPQPGPEASIGTEAGLFHACLPSRPAKPAAYADRLLRYG